MSCVTGKSPGALRSRFNLRPVPIFALIRRKEGCGFQMDLRGQGPVSPENFVDVSS